ncbi:MAG: cytochrome-c peroxidase [Planctomycetota bacterium]|jgi:cytochrome c peroxidase
MKRFTYAVTFIGLAALGGCSEKSTTVVEAEQAAIDGDLRTALAAAGIHAIDAPAAEDPQLVELGRALFFDKILSGNLDISCATCHTPVAGTGDNLPVSIGTGGSGSAELRQVGTGALIPRNAPSVFNLGVEGMHSMFWDSRVHRDPDTGVLTTPEAGLNGPAPTLDELAAPLTSPLAAQAMFPVTSHDEMRGQPGENAIANAADNEQVWGLLMSRLAQISEYETMFLSAFGAASMNDLNFGHAARAIAAFERDTWTALDTPFDRYLRGDNGALSEQQKRGALLFATTAGCTDCHNGPLLTDLEHHALAVPQIGPGKNAPNEDLGLALESGDAADNYKFRTPPLRNVELTGPWMHDGCFTSLESTVLHVLDPATSCLNYDGSDLRADFQATLDSDATRIGARIAALAPELGSTPTLTDAEVDDLLAFLHALTDPASLNLLNDAPATVPSGLPVPD